MRAIFFGRRVVVAVACAALAGSLCAQRAPGPAGHPQDHPTILNPGKPIERLLRGGERHVYAIRARAGQFVHATVDQLGVDVVLTLFAPDGKPAGSMDSPNGSFGLEQISAIADASGTYRLEVAPDDKTAPAGRYRVTAERPRAPRDQDRARITAEGLFVEAVQLQVQGNANAHMLAISKYVASLSGWRTAGDRSEEALTLDSIGRLHSDGGDKSGALVNYSQALTIWRSIPDRRGEATTLSDLGATYRKFEEKQQALECDLRALPLWRVLEARREIATTLNNIGIVYADLGERQKALDYYAEALPLWPALGARRQEATTRSNIAVVYSELGEKQRALEFYGQALAISRAVGDDAGEATVLSNLGNTYVDLAEHQKALEYYAQALPLHRTAGDRPGEATTLNNIGKTYADLGDQQKALDYYGQSLAIRQALPSRSHEATTLSNMGVVYAQLGDRQKALDHFSQALPLVRALGARAAEATILNNIGGVYADLGERQKAIDYCSQALALHRSVGNRGGEAATLSNIGQTYGDGGEWPKALPYLTEAVPLYRAVHDPLGEASAEMRLMDYWTSLKNPALAVFFGKQAIDRFQQVRRNNTGLDRQAQRSFLKSKEDDYRDLAELLVSTGRLPEAQQVLDLLKAEEYSEFTQHRGAASAGADPVALTPLEEKSKKDYDEISTDIATVGEAWAELHDKPARSDDEEHRYNELSDKLTAANQRLQAFLKTLYEGFGKGEQANAKVDTINEQTASLQSLVGELGAGTAAVYTMVLDQKCVLMVITPAARVARELPISRADLRSKVFAFLGALARHQPDQAVQAKAKDLYQVLIAPIEHDLQGARAKTLVWSLDDVLRYVPLAALYDGSQYLVERYRNVVITTASVGNLKDTPRIGQWRGAAMGVSRDYDGLGTLTAVPDELASVVHSDATPGSHGPVPGTILLDDAFTKTGMERALAQHPPLVHIASHYVFHVGDDTNSYLLLGGKETGGQAFHLTLADLRDDQRVDFKGIELLTLSGCQTAVGSHDSDGREIDGLGITAQRKGAKAVMATLWEVDDASVGLLMATFYKLWVTTPGLTKAEALQQAQLSLLRGTDGSTASQAAPRYADPYYWAPFVLIGNWK